MTVKDLWNAYMYVCVYVCKYVCNVGELDAINLEANWWKQL